MCHRRLGRHNNISPCSLRRKLSIFLKINWEPDSNDREKSMNRGK